MTSRNVKNFEFKLGRQGLLLFVIGMSFLLLFVFIIGVMVGVHIDAYPEKIAKEVPEIIRRQLYRPEEKVEKPGREESAKALGENNKLAAFPSPSLKTEDQKGASLAGDKKTASAALVPPADNLNAPAEKIISPPEEDGGTKPTTPAVISKDKEVKPHPADSVEVPDKSEKKGGGKYLVQLASLKNYEKAKQFCKKIKPLGYNPRIEVAELPKKGKWFRVVVDGFATRDEAKKTAGVLSEKIDGLNCIIRPVR